MTCTIPSRIRLFALIGLALSALFSVTAHAERSQDFGEYVVHFNALPSGFIPSATARQYGIVRSKQRAILNVSVLKKNKLGTSAAAVEADVDVLATNLNGQSRSIDLRQVQEEAAIYQLGTFRITDAETLDFILNVTPKGSKATYTVKFRQQFFVGN